MKPIVIGYHGCDQKVAMAVVTGKTSLKWSENRQDWLGHGTYFWEDDPHRALDWAKECAVRTKTTDFQPSVLGAVIDLTNCLNLVQTEAYTMVRAAYEALEAIVYKSKMPMPKNTGFEEGARYLDCAVFQTLHDIRKDEGKDPFPTVRAFFPEGDAVFPGSGILKRDHIQICVRNHKAVVGYFLTDL